MPSATRPPLTSSSAKLTDQAGGRRGDASQSSASAAAEDRSPVFKKSVASTSNPSGDCLKSARAGWASSSDRW